MAFVRLSWPLCVCKMVFFCVLFIAFSLCDFFLYKSIVSDGFVVGGFYFDTSKMMMVFFNGNSRLKVSRLLSFSCLENKM